MAFAGTSPDAILVVGMGTHLVPGHRAGLLWQVKLQPVGQYGSRRTRCWSDRGTAGGTGDGTDVDPPKVAGSGRWRLSTVEPEVAGRSGRRRSQRLLRTQLDSVPGPQFRDAGGATICRSVLLDGRSQNRTGDAISSEPGAPTGRAGGPDAVAALAVRVPWTPGRAGRTQRGGRRHLRCGKRRMACVEYDLPRSAGGVVVGTDASYPVTGKSPFTCRAGAFRRGDEVGRRDRVRQPRARDGGREGLDG